MNAIKMKRILINICKYVLLIFAAFVALVPIVSCIFTAFKTEEEYASTNVITLPKNFLNFDNFIIAWNKANMGKAFLNSFIILICVLAGSIMISAMLAYVLNRFKFPGNKLIRNLFTIATLIPGIASQVTVYQIMTALHLVNSMPGYIILMMGTDVITIYIFLQFFENLSSTLDESAILDGCTYFGVFFKILLPLLKPAIVTSAILKGVSTYNEYYMANLYLQDKTKYQVVATSLYVFSGPMGNQYNYICAGVIITIIPALIVFLLCQDQIYSGMAAGGRCHASDKKGSTGRDFWRSGQQDARPAQGPKWTLGTARGKPFSASTTFSRHPHFSFIICCFSRFLCRSRENTAEGKQTIFYYRSLSYEQRKNVLRCTAQHPLAGKAC